MSTWQLITLWSALVCFASVGMIQCSGDNGAQAKPKPTAPAWPPTRPTSSPAPTADPEPTDQPDPEEPDFTRGVPSDFRKFRDGDAVCYHTYGFPRAISCVVLPEVRDE